MTKTEFFILWAISIVIYLFTFQISLTLTVILNIILTISYVFHKRIYIKTLNKKINSGQLKYLEFKNKKSVLELFAIPIIYLILNIVSLTKMINLGENLILLNLLLLFVPTISMFLINFKNPELNNGLIIGQEYYQKGLTGSKIKKSELNVKRGKKASELIIENSKNGKNNTYEFENPESVLNELKNIA